MVEVMVCERGAVMVQGETVGGHNRRSCEPICPPSGATGTGSPSEAPRCYG